MKLGIATAFNYIILLDCDWSLGCWVSPKARGPPSKRSVTLLLQWWIILVTKYKFSASCWKIWHKMCARSLVSYSFKRYQQLGLHGLASLMYLDSNDTYLPLMMVSGLIVDQYINTKRVGNRKGLMPSISKGYTWDDFFLKFSLTSMKSSHAYVGRNKSRSFSW
jgi:CDP-diglyceride synthetase